MAHITKHELIHFRTLLDPYSPHVIPNKPESMHIEFHTDSGMLQVLSDATQIQGSQLQKGTCLEGPPMGQFAQISNLLPIPGGPQIPKLH